MVIAPRVARPDTLFLAFLNSSMPFVLLKRDSTQFMLRPHLLGYQLLGIVENPLEAVRRINDLLIDLVVYTRKKKHVSRFHGRRKISPRKSLPQSAGFPQSVVPSTRIPSP